MDYSSDMEHPLIMKSVNGYDIIEMIGCGSFGDVFLCKKNDKFFAMKVYSKYDFFVNERKGRFKGSVPMIKDGINLYYRDLELIINERDILRSIDNKYIIKYEEHYQDEKNLYLITEFVQGGDMFSLFTLLHKLGEDDAKFYANEILSAISYLHDNNIAHCDLKFENILLCNGHIKLCDFGFSRKFKPNQKFTDFMGTPDYLSPEMVSLMIGKNKKGFDEKIDVWAFGVIIFELVAGYNPFNKYGRISRDELFFKILKRKIIFPSDFSENLMDLLRSIFYKSNRPSINDIKNHVWFKSRDMDAPWNPYFLKDGDTRCFAKYWEDDIDRLKLMNSYYDKKITDNQQKFFKSF